MTQEEGYQATHQFLRAQYGLAQKCEECGKKGEYKGKWNLEWALKKGRTYSRRIEDYRQLCCSCHRKYDYTENQRVLVSKANQGLRKYGRKIAQFTKDGELISGYDAIRDAENITGISHTAIQNCLAGRSKSAGGFIWIRES